ncbi:asparagine synthase (glutamine-hydrolyzing) [Parasphingorhabdus sp.]
MCGIFGSLGAFDGAAKDPLSIIRRRGPDSSGEWCDKENNVFLGHRRLSILDLSPAGNQPMVSEDGRYIMVYNGEIYNYQELRLELEAAGRSFLGHSDSEVLLKLFEQQGTAAFEKLNGIFAVAFWDRDQRVLTLARDAVGVKPLYYSEVSNGVAFASEMKVLIRGGFVNPSINPRAVLHHLSYLYSPGRETIVNEVQKLLPGEYVQYKDGQKVNQAIFFDPIAPPGTKQEISVEKAVVSVRDALETAIGRQLISDVPLGAFLSGGLDSSSIAAFASRIHNGPGKLECFSIDISEQIGAEGLVDDLPYARSVAKHLDVNLNVIKAEGNMIDRLGEMIYFLDEPTADFAALNTLYIAELARSKGIKVLLSGSGGDDIFTGYRRHFALMQERYWSWLPKTGRSILSSAAKTLPSSPPISRRVGKAFQYADLNVDQRLASYFLWLDPAEALGLLSPELRAGLSDDDVSAPMLKSLEGLASGHSPLERMLYLEGKHFLADHNLNYADKMGMAASVEIRVPLLDRDLINTVLSLPDDFKQRGGTGKWIFKKAMEGILPDDIIYRKKTGFGVPLREWLKGPLKSQVASLLSDENIKRQGLFDPVAVQQLIAANDAGKVDASYTIFAVLCLQIWCDQFIDGNFAID